MSKKPKEKNELNAKQLRFCEEYIKDLNATQAAVRAGYSEKTAQEQSSRLLSNVIVQQKTQELIGQRSKRTNIDADVILTELLKLATVDIGEAYDNLGQLKPFNEMPEHVRKAVSGVEIFEQFVGHGDDRELIGFVKKVKFWDKTKALELLGKHLSLFADRVKQEVSFSGEPMATVVILPSNGRERN